MFPAMQERNYRLHFTGQLIAISGLWLQLMAQSWRVHELTHSASWVGFIVAFPFAVSSLLTPFGGIIADRFDKRKVQCWAQAFSATLCFLLAAMFFCECETLARIIAINFFFGVMLGVDNPARNSFIPDLVSEENIRSGISLNGAMVMMAQVVGPGIAGGMLSMIGVGWTFVVSGLTCSAVIITMSMMRIIPSYKKAEEHPFKMFWHGLKYTFLQPTIRLCVSLGGIIGMFSFSYRAVLPVITKEIYSAGPEMMSFLAFSAGLGSFTGAVLAQISKKLRFRLQVFGGALIAGLALLAFSAVSSPVIGAALLFLTGLGFSLGFATVRAVSQVVSKPVMRGRVTGFTMMLFFGGVSIGSFATGCLAKSFGCPAALATCGIVFLMLTSVMSVFKVKT